MLFNSGTDSIVSEIDSLCDSDSTSYPIADKTRRVNIALDEVVSIILEADGRWEFDGSNLTDLPIATTTLVDAQQDYAFASELLMLERVEVKDSTGTYHKLIPISQSDIDVALTEYKSSDGMPTHYDKIGNSIFLYPAPATASVTVSQGLKVYFKRNVDKFTTADTTQAPGFASPFHSILAYMASIPYCMTYKQDRVGMYENKVLQIKDSIKSFYSRRSKDEVARLVPHIENTR